MLTALKNSLAVFIFILLPISPLFAEEAAPQELPQESDQQINDFSLSASGDKGKKLWDISGKSADVLTDVVKLKDLTANMYGEEENVKLTADKGDFNKQEGKVHVEDNVVITTSSGAKLTTDSMDWDRKNQLVTTKDKVHIDKEGMVTTATGAKGEPNLNKVTLEKDVRVDIDSVSADSKDKGEKNKIIITCDGTLTVDYEKNIATFNKNVVVISESAQINSDVMDVYFNKAGSASPVAAGGAAEEKAPGLMGNKIDKIIARGNVKILNGENTSYSEEAIYDGADKKITLVGRPKLVILSTEDLNASLGN